MGIFDRFKKKESQAKQPDLPSEQEERLQNYPQMLMTRLLFVERPRIDTNHILELMNARVCKTELAGSDNAIIFSFPEIKVHLADAVIAAQCGILVPEDKLIEIPAEGFQQNWHWPEAAEVASSCGYEILLSNLMSRNLDYKQQFEVFMNFVAVVTEVTGPTAIYSVDAHKIVQPGEALSFNGEHYLRVLVNVRMFNLEQQEETLMDTVGLSKFGLPDFQCRFKSHNANDIAQLLWNYVYYVFENGDVIESENTLQGVGPDSKWKCNRVFSLVEPDRVVIDIIPG